MILFWIELLKQWAKRVCQINRDIYNAISWGLLSAWIFKIFIRKPNITRISIYWEYLRKIRFVKMWDNLPALQVSKPLKSLQIKTTYIKLTSIALNCQTSNKKEVSHESKKSGKNLAGLSQSPLEKKTHFVLIRWLFSSSVRNLRTTNLTN